jgi:sarcosine oxidase subunit beta
MEQRAEVLIAGGGVVGSAIAAALVERGVSDVCVLDLDLKGRWSSSERNAGGARATWWQPVNIATCRDTLALFRANAARLSFRACGYLWLYDDGERFARALGARRVQDALGVQVDVLQTAELARRFPLLDRNLDEIVGATFSPGDGLMNPNEVRRFYRERAELGGARFVDLHWIDAVDTAERGGVRTVERVHAVEISKEDRADDGAGALAMLTGRGIPAGRALEAVVFRPKTFVLALGAWSPLVCAKLGVPGIAQPVRRQIALADVRAGDVAPGVELAALGMIVDASGAYFHPEGPYVLAGYSPPATPPGYEFDYDGDAFFESEIWPRLAHRASSFERMHHVRGWAGLYSVTPDCSGVAGAIPGFSNAIEAHSFTGRGVMQSWAIGRGIAELVTAGRYETLDLAPLSRTRFERGDLIPEELHI